MTRSYQNNKERRSNAIKLCKPVRARVVGTLDWTKYPGGLNEVERALNISHSHICRCCQGKIKNYNGYEFEYDAPNEPDLLPGEEWRDVILPEKATVLQ